MNSWIAEEIRPIGIDLAWTRTFASDYRLHLAGTVFGGNDTSGTLLAWRGFSFHGRPTPTGRFVPLPPFEGFRRAVPETERGGDEGLRLRSRRPARLRRAGPLKRSGRSCGDPGDRVPQPGGPRSPWPGVRLGDGLRWLSVETALPARLRLLGEWGTGTSLMGIAPPGQRSEAVVDVLFDTFYLLLSREWKGGTFRTTARYDDFKVRDRDSIDDNREEGRAWTLALMVPLGEHWRAGVELLDLEADRPAARRAGSPPLDGDSVRAELKLAF